MARSKGRSGGGRSGGGRATSSRRAETVADEVEVVEESGGMGIDDGIIIMTTLLLLAAVLFVDYTRGAFYGEGVMFKGNYEAPEGFDASMATPEAE